MSTQPDIFTFDVSVSKEEACSVLLPVLVTIEM